MNIRDRLQRRSQPWGCWLSAFAFSWLVFAGCTGCGERQEQPMPRTAAQQTDDGHPHDDGRHPLAPGEHSHPADGHAGHADSPPVRVPPRPTLTRIPAARQLELFRNPPIRPAATWEARKRQVAEHPELAWQPWFIVPPIADPHNPPSLGELWDYDTVADAVTFSESQNKRMDAIALEMDQKRVAGTLSEAEYKRLDRKRDEIRFEGLDLLTAAKYCLRYHMAEGLALKYAEKAVRKHRKSPAARHVLSLVLDRLGRKEEALAALRQMLALDPNSSIALRDLAWKLRQTHPHEALGYIQKAIRLDARIPKYNFLLAECYEYLGQYDKALEVYQNMTSIDFMGMMRNNIIAIQAGAPLIHPVGAAGD